MRTRDVAFVGLKLVAILIARQAVFPLTRLISQTGSPRWVIVSDLLSFALFLGIGFALWAYAGTLADSMAGSADPLTPSPESRVTLRSAVTAAAALLGLWILALGLFETISGIGDYLSARQIFPATASLRSVAVPISNPLRTQALWRIVSGAVQSGIGLLLIAMRASIANVVTPKD